MFSGIDLLLKQNLYFIAFLLEFLFSIENKFFFMEFYLAQSLKSAFC